MIPIEYCIQLYGAQHLEKALRRIEENSRRFMAFFANILSIDMTSYPLNPSDNLLKKVQ